MVPTNEEPAKHGSKSKASNPPPNRRLSVVPSRDRAHSEGRSLPDIQTVLCMPEDAVWGLRKHDLRNCFLLLRQYALNPYPLNPPNPAKSTLLTPPSDNLPPLLRLPLEIRQQIYICLLPPPVSPPLKGPHPRQLQNPIYFSQPVPTSLLCLNHQIHTESLPFLYGSPTQTTSITIDHNLWAHKTNRGTLVLSSSLTSSLKNIHITIHLGSEKKSHKIGELESEARIQEVKKGLKKVRKWLFGAEIQCLRVSWQEPKSTFTWVQKREVLDGLRGLKAWRVEVGDINWGLDWNKGRKYRFEVEYLKELERGQKDSEDS